MGVLVYVRPTSSHNDRQSKGANQAHPATVG